MKPQVKMAHIKEPKGIDFIIQSPPLSDKEKKEISDLVKKIKAKSSRPGIGKKKKVKKEITE